MANLMMKCWDTQEYKNYIYRVPVLGDRGLISTDGNSQRTEHLRTSYTQVFNITAHG